jgi:hypothetical protein
VRERELEAKRERARRKRLRRPPAEE